MHSFLADAMNLTIVTAAITAVVVLLTRLAFRRGKKLEEP